MLRLVLLTTLLIFVFSIPQTYAQTKEGIASFYNGRFHGRKTASGIIHDNNALVAAHRTYPFGTYLRVTNLSNNKSVVVRITDRGPRKKSRIIDLSREAARQLDFMSKGLTKVKIEVVPEPIVRDTLDLLSTPKIPQIPINRLTPETHFSFPKTHEINVKY